MHRHYLASLMLLVVICLTLPAQEIDDETAIIAVGMDYFKAFYLGDAELAGRTMHPELQKRFVGKNSSGRDIIGYSGRSMLIEYAAAGAGKGDLAEKNVQVEVFEINGNIATGKVTSRDTCDYVHFAKVNGDWYVLNVLWIPARE